MLIASVPVFVSAIKLLGKRGLDGRRRHAVALSSFTVSQRHLAFDVETRGPTANGSSLETLSVDMSDRTVWYAPTGVTDAGAALLRDLGVRLLVVPSSVYLAADGNYGTLTDYSQLLQAQIAGLQRQLRADPSFALRARPASRASKAVMTARWSSVDCLGQPCSVGNTDSGA